MTHAQGANPAGLRVQMIRGAASRRDAPDPAPRPVVSTRRGAPGSGIVPVRDRRAIRGRRWRHAAARIPRNGAL